MPGSRKSGRLGGKIASGNRIVIKNPEFFTVYMREQLQALV